MEAPAKVKATVAVAVEAPPISMYTKNKITVFENHRKSRIQHSSYVYILSGQKFIKNANKVVNFGDLLKMPKLKNSNATFSNNVFEARKFNLGFSIIRV